MMAHTNLTNQVVEEIIEIEQDINVSTGEEAQYLITKRNELVKMLESILTGERTFESSSYFGELVYEAFNKEAEKYGRALFIDDVVEADEFADRIDELSLSGNTSNEIRMRAAFWASAAAKEAFASGFAQAVKLMALESNGADKLKAEQTEGL